MHDIIIVGGGPAGLTAAVYALRAGKTALVIEKAGFGGQIAFSPKVENIPGTILISGAEFADKLAEQVMALGADVEMECVTGVEKTANGFTVTTEEGSSFEGKAILFSRVTCPNCKVAEAQLTKAGVPFEKLIADENVELCKQYGIKGAPTLVITDGTNFQTYYSVAEIKKYLTSL